MMEIKNLSVETSEGKLILEKINCDFENGKIYALMGSNGSGKSTLANTIMGSPRYKITDGKIMFNQEEINELSPDKRARLGIFLSFQNPKEIPGINFQNFLREARKSVGKGTESITEFRKIIYKNAKKLEAEKLIERNLNEGFSGGERKKSEIIQMLTLDPKLIILDEPDSGLDIDGLKNLSKILKKFKREDKIVIIISHYTKLLKYLKPDKIFVMSDGKITRSGEANLLKEIEKKGFKR